MADRNRAPSKLTQTRLALAQAEYRDVKERYDMGLAGRESVRAAVHQLRAMEAALARLQLELQEIQASVGLAAELEVKRAEVDLLEREIELQRIQRELARPQSLGEVIARSCGRRASTARFDQKAFST